MTDIVRTIDGYEEDIENMREKNIPEKEIRKQIVEDMKYEGFSKEDIESLIKKHFEIKEPRDKYPRVVNLENGVKLLIARLHFNQYEISAFDHKGKMLDKFDLDAEQKEAV
jgi:hypothetical protein